MTIPEMLDSLKTYIREIIQDKVDIAHQKAVSATNSANSSASSASAAANSAREAGAAVQSAITELVGQAPETLNTLEEFAEALGNNPNFATATAASIGERAKTADVNAALDQKSDKGHKHESADITDAVTAVGPGTPNGRVAVSNGGELMRQGTADPTNSAALVSKFYVDKYLGQKAPSTHTHGITAVDGLQPALDGKVSGSGITLWAGTLSGYVALPEATRNGAGFIAFVNNGSALSIYVGTGTGAVQLGNL